MQWNKGNHDTLLNFHANALLPKYMPLFKLICCQMMRSSHTSNVVVERAPLLFAIVKNMKINVGNLIYDRRGRCSSHLKVCGSQLSLPSCVAKQGWA